MLEKLESELKAFEREAGGRDWKDPAVLEDLCAQIRNIGTKYCHSGDLQGYIVSANGVDVSRRLLEWPEHVFDGGELKFRMCYLESGDLFNKDGVIVDLKVLEPVAIPSALKQNKPVEIAKPSEDK